MSYFLVKANVRRGRDAKLKKEGFVVKATDYSFAGVKVGSELNSIDPTALVTDVNLKNYVEVFMIEGGDGPLYEIQLEFDDVDGKTVKELYLQQANATAEAEALLLENLSDPNVEIVNTKKTNIVDYFIGE